MRLGACETGLGTPSNFVFLVVPGRYFCGGSVCFVFWSRFFALFEPYVRFHIFSSVRVTEWVAYWGIAAHSAYDTFS